MSATNLIEEAKKKAAHAAIDAHVKSGMALGIGSGSTIVYAVERLAARVRSEGLAVVCVPTSFQSRELIVAHGLPLSDLERTPSLDVAFDGADECDDALNLIKGGGGCLLQEKLVASCAKQLVIVADYRKNARQLGTVWRQGVPIEVLPLARQPVLLRLKSREFSLVSAVTRTGTGKAGPLLTDNGNFIIDADFGPIADPQALDRALAGIVGVIDTGLFCNMTTKIYFGAADGTVFTKENEPSSLD
jgi:ribose 5-phosphate isomerase A